MNNEPKKDPGERLRKLLGSTSPLTRLPKKADASAVSFLPKIDEDKKDALVNADAANQTPPKPDSVSKSKGLSLENSTLKNLKLGPPFWTIASIISMTVNVVVLIVLLALLFNVKGLNIGNILGLGNNLLGGLYSNFEKMDLAHITSTIPVQTTIPVKFDLQLNQQTNVVLSRDVTINNALVTVNTGGLNITRALTTIVLPEGTILPVVLNLTVPVDTTVPVVLNVAVDIPLNQTQLHEPFTGLQEVVKPFYCMINPAAVKLDGRPVCQ